MPNPKKSPSSIAKESSRGRNSEEPAVESQGVANLEPIGKDPNEESDKDEMISELTLRLHQADRQISNLREQVTVLQVHKTKIKRISCFVVISLLLLVLSSLLFPPSLLVGNHRKNEVGGKEANR
jgi:hypothetical protein